MTNKEKQDWLKDKYPLTIITDRYSGTYSDGYYLAFPLDYDEIPIAVNGDDLICAAFWKAYYGPVGKGSSVQAAIDDLIYKMHKQTESEDERIIQNLIDAFTEYKKSGGVDFHSIEINTLLAWLEKQKELFESGRGLYYYDGEKTTYCGYPATEENPYDFAMSQQQEKQKEQKPRWEINIPYTTKWTKEMIDEKFKELVEEYHKQKPAEWSEEDGVNLASLINYFEGDALDYSTEDMVRWLKSLPARFNLQPKQEWSEEDEKMRWNLINAFTDKNNSKVDEFMQLRATKADIIDWLKSLRPSWKPSDEQMKALLNAEKYLNAGLQYGSARRIAELIKQFKKLGVKEEPEYYQHFDPDC